MSDTFDHEGDAWECYNRDDYDEDTLLRRKKSTVKCNRCGSCNVKWAHNYPIGGWRLYNPDKTIHTCNNAPPFTHPKQNQPKVAVWPAMTAKKLHNFCMEAYCDCPQNGNRFREFEDSQYWGARYKTLEDVTRVWMNDDTLWNRGYSESLDQEARDYFKDLHKAQQNVIKLFCETYNNAK